MSQNDSVCLFRIIGDRLRALREANSKSQGDVASAARACGLQWSRATVAAIELGRRHLRLEEFLSLPMILYTAKIQHEDEPARLIELADMLPQDGWVALSPQARIHAGALHAVVQGKFSESALTEQDTPALRKARVRFQRAGGLDRLTQDIQGMSATVRRLWPEAEKNLTLMDQVWRQAKGDVELKAAQKLNVSPFSIALASHKLWKQSFAEERDRRVTKQIPADASLRTRQATRGHVSRGMLAELQPLLSDERT